MRVLEFMFYKVYHFYNSRWPGKDADVYAMCFVAVWLYFLVIFLALILCNVAAISFVLSGAKRWWILVPGVFFQAAGWMIWLHHDQYKRIAANKDLRMLGRSRRGKWLISFLLLLPCLFLVIALLTKRTP